MTTAKYTRDMKNARGVIRLLMMCGRMALMKRWENGYYGHYLVTNEGMEIRINEQEYEIAYKAYYQER